MIALLQLPPETANQDRFVGACRDMKGLTVVSKTHANSPEDPADEQQESVIDAAAGGSLENGANYEGCPSNLHGPVTQQGRFTTP